MKTLLTLTITLLTLTSCSPSLNCSDFKTGMYRYVNIGMPTEIERTATMQTETDPIDKIVVKSVVTWTSECEYILTYSEILNHPKDVNDVIGKKIYCAIISTDGKKLKVHATSDSMDEIIEFVKVD